MFKSVWQSCIIFHDLFLLWSVDWSQSEVGISGKNNNKFPACFQMKFASWSELTVSQSCVRFSHKFVSQSVDGGGQRCDGGEMEWRTLWLSLVTPILQHITAVSQYSNTTSHLCHNNCPMLQHNFWSNFLSQPPTKYLVPILILSSVHLNARWQYVF